MGLHFLGTANSLEVYIGYLRRKTEADGGPRLLHTVCGVGYVLRETPPELIVGRPGDGANTSGANSARSAVTLRSPAIESRSTTAEKARNTRRHTH